MRIRELLAARAATDIVGREAELARLRRLLVADGPRIAHVYGLPGVGKSTLLRSFATQARQTGAEAIYLDCREIEPTENGFLAALAEAIGHRSTRAEALVRALGSGARHTVLVLDAFEVLRLLDTWLRLSFVPRLTTNACVVLAGRHPPTIGWLSDGWQQLTLNLPLGPLSAGDSAALLARAGLDPGEARRVGALLHGHPLALRLAVSALIARPNLYLPDATLQGVMEDLTAMYLADAGDLATRRALEGACVLRCITVSLLGAVTPELEADENYARLNELAFTESSREGLMLHEAVRDALAQTLRARDPERYHDYRRRAWYALVSQSANAARPELWRYTADMLHLIEHPVVREAFFPSGAAQITVEHARARDADAIRDITEHHEGPCAAAALLGWWRRYPETFVVARDAQCACAGFCCRFDPGTLPTADLSPDPIATAWLADLGDNPLPEGGRALFIRRWLARDEGERPGEAQAALWLDLKRTYMEMRPHLRRVYLAVADLDPYARVAGQLGFRVIAAEPVVVDGRPYRTAVLDFGPESVDGWLAGLAAAELGLHDSRDILDRDARELVLDGSRIELTPLEFGVLCHLQDHAGSAVSRDTMLREVWQSSYTGWSNKVDAVIACLRRKLGPHAECIETVTGVGYRYRRRRGNEGTY